MRRFVLLIITLICCYSCAKKTEFSGTVIEIDPTKAKDYFLDHLADSIVVFSLHEQEPIGEIYTMKGSDRYLFMHDQYQSKIHIFDWSGNKINTLHKIGEGPQEYLDITEFTYNSAKEELHIYASETSWNVYSVPDLNLISKDEIQSSFGTFAFLQPDQLLRISDYSNGNRAGVIDLFDTSTNNTQIITDRFLPIPLMGYIYSFPLMLSGDGNAVYYCQPYSSVVYRIDEHADVRPLFQVAFTKNGLPEEAWHESEIYLFQDRFFRDRQAFAVHNFIPTDSTLSFWYFYPDNRKEFPIPVQGYTRNTHTGEAKHIQNLKINGTDISLVPLGTHRQFYLSLIDPESIGAIDPQSTGLAREIYQKATVQDGTVLPVVVMYSF